jgi:hypothetical protein
LGDDKYHTRRFPHTADQFEGVKDGIGMPDAPELDIVCISVDFARIIRRVALEVYVSTSSLHEKLLRAKQIGAELDSWLANLPGPLRPSSYYVQGNPLKAIQRSKFLKKQQLVLIIREFWNFRLFWML